MLEVKKVITALYRKANDYARVVEFAEEHENVEYWRQKENLARKTIKLLKEQFGIEYN